MSNMLLIAVGFYPRDISYLSLFTAILIGFNLFLQHITVILVIHPVLHRMLSSLWLLYICGRDEIN